MTFPSARLPLELRYVEEAYAAALVPPDADLKRCTFIVKLGEASQAHRNSTDKKIQETLTKNWLRHWQWTLEYDGLPPLLLRDMDACIKHIANAEFATSWSTTPDQKRLLATLCIQRVFLLDRSHSQNVEAPLLELITTLNSRSSIGELQVGIRSVTTYLFGEACWELYKNDVNWIGHMIKLIWRNKIPLLSASIKTAYAAKIPPDLV